MGIVMKMVADLLHGDLHYVIVDMSFFSSQFFVKFWNKKRTFILVLRKRRKPPSFVVPSGPLSFSPNWYILTQTLCSFSHFNAPRIDMTKPCLESMALFMDYGWHPEQSRAAYLLKSAKHPPYSQQAQTKRYILFVLDGWRSNESTTGHYARGMYIPCTIYIVHVFELLDQTFAILDPQLGAVS